MKVFVILVNYNGCKDTLECINSLLKVKYSKMEIVVVDNASTDESVPELKKYDEKITLMISPVNGGFAKGNNIGIKYALKEGADYILLLNNDTIVDKNFLNPLLDTAAEYKNTAVVSSKICYASDHRRIWFAGGKFYRLTGRVVHIGYGRQDTQIYNRQKEVSYLSGCCMLIPKKIIQNVGLMEEKYFLYCEDLDYCCRIQKTGYKLVYEPDSVIYHKINATTSKQKGSVGYYTFRNKLYCIKTHSKLWYRWINIIFLMCETAKRLCTGEYDLSMIKKGYHDYRYSKFGERII